MSPEAAEHFDQLHPFDRAHLIAVATDLMDQGECDDLVMAGLLHDIGKADRQGSIRLIDRVFHAMLPNPWSRRLANVGGVGRVFSGLPALANHAQVGADWLEAWDYPKRAIWLVRNHEWTGSDDRDLHALIEADGRCIGSTH